MVFCCTLEAPGQLCQLALTNWRLSARKAKIFWLTGCEWGRGESRRKTPASEPESDRSFRNNPKQANQRNHPIFQTVPRWRQGDPSRTACRQEKGIDLTQVVVVAQTAVSAKQMSNLRHPAGRSAGCNDHATGYWRVKRYHSPSCAKQSAAMAASKTTVPHFYVTSDIDMAEALALRKQSQCSFYRMNKRSLSTIWL